MPTGVHLPCRMDNEIVAMFYHCLKNGDQKTIDFSAVAVAVGEPDATRAYVKSFPMTK